MNLPAFDAIAFTNFRAKLECFFFLLEDLMAVGTISLHYCLPQVLNCHRFFFDPVFLLSHGPVKNLKITLLPSTVPPHSNTSLIFISLSILFCNLHLHPNIAATF